ncbi:MAG: ABC transporter ATP-binding protein [Chloroflexi bacterium]|nr:MAG: ABC transporter ATP-binding protein [Chloroflexota bacterium]
MLLQASAIKAGYGPTLIVDDVSLRIEPGEIVCVLGRNGMGKTTLLKSLLGLIKRTGGTVQIAGRAVDGWPAHRIARLGVGYAPQERAVFHELTVGDNLRLCLSRGVDGSALASVLDTFPVLAGKLGQQAGSLSGGEQKILVLAEAILGSPGLVVLDEVVEGVQPSIVNRFIEVIRTVNQRSGSAFLIVEQNIGFALKLASRFLVMKGGRIVDEGPTQEGTRTAVERHFIL